MSKRATVKRIGAAVASVALLGSGAAAAVAVAAKPSGKPTSAHAPIPVYGRWTISVHHQGHATVRRFENALTTTGQEALTALLGGTATNPTWSVSLRVRGGASVQATGGNGLSVTSLSTLTTNIPNVLVLQGAAQATNTMNVVEVLTRIGLTQDNGTTNVVFTDATLTDPITAAAGDTVGIHVEIGFGAAPQATSPTSTSTTAAQTATAATSTSPIIHIVPSATTGQTTTIQTLTTATCRHDDGWGPKYNDCTFAVGDISLESAESAAEHAFPSTTVLLDVTDCTVNGTLIMVRRPDFGPEDYIWWITGPYAGKTGDFPDSQWTAESGVPPSSTPGSQHGLLVRAHADPTSPHHGGGGCSVAGPDDIPNWPLYEAHHNNPWS